MGFKCFNQVTTLAIHTQNYFEPLGIFRADCWNHFSREANAREKGKGRGADHEKREDCIKKKKLNAGQN